MARVATNQDQAEAERARYVYVQHAKMVSRHGGTVMCEEITDYRMTPSSEGSHEELLNLDGRQRKNHEYLTYHALRPDQVKTKTEDPPKKDPDPATIPVTISDDSIDRDIVQNMRWNLIHDKSKDGISAHLFPLTSKDQQDYLFHMVGRERMNGRDVFHISFLPKKKDDFGWSGDAFIDTAAFQPVLVTTGMARKTTLRGAHASGDESSRPRLHRDLCAATGWRMVSSHFLDRIQDSRALFLQSRGDSRRPEPRIRKNARNVADCGGGDGGGRETRITPLATLTENWCGERPIER